MRTDPLLGKKPWFGPRRFGWGLSPVSVEGWLAVLAALAASAALTRRGESSGDDAGSGVAKLPAIILVAVAVLKCTTPGGPRAWRKYKAAREQAGAAGEQANAAE